jgi:hypothetical protein
MSFSNYFQTLLYLFQVVIQDDWGQTFTTILRSHSSALVLTVVFCLPMMLTMTMNGFVIASYLCEIERRIDAEVPSLYTVRSQ